MGNAQPSSCCLASPQGRTPSTQMNRQQPNVQCNNTSAWQAGCSSKECELCAELCMQSIQQPHSPSQANDCAAEAYRATPSMQLSAHKSMQLSTDKTCTVGSFRLTSVQAICDAMPTSHGVAADNTYYLLSHTMCCHRVLKAHDAGSSTSSSTRGLRTTNYPRHHKEATSPNGRDAHVIAACLPYESKPFALCLMYTTAPWLMTRRPLS